MIDPFTKDNIFTYIVKENVPISFNLVNVKMNPRQAILRNFYYRTVRNKNIKIRCLDTIYFGGNKINIVPNEAFSVLKATNRLNGCIFIFQFEYDLVENNKINNKVMQFAFKIVSEKEYKMYEDMEIFNKIKEKNEKIIRPKKVS